MAAPTCSVGVLSANWIVNRAALVSRAKAAVPFASVAWDSSTWDVSETYRHRTRAYKADRLHSGCCSHNIASRLAYTVRAVRAVW
ncbi:hypothetical protein ADM96_18655 [Burkholderia sp. ST111]|nr:hypothetical protein ADM96_18655 [Burkholderia sp. ST111]